MLSKIILLIYIGAVLVMSSSCMRDPSMWSPEDHIRVSRSCRVVCHATGVKKYDSMDGSCECRERK